MRLKLAIFINLICLPLCFGQINETQALMVQSFKLASPNNLVLSASVENGRLLTAQADAKAIRAEISEQLKYTLGQLNQIQGLAGASPILASFEIEIIGRSQSPLAHQLAQVSYRAHFVLTWPVEVPIPKNLDLILPAQASTQALTDFARDIGNEFSGKKCAPKTAFFLSPKNFWYYFRPYEPGCPLSQLTSSSPLQAPLMVTVIKAKLEQVMESVAIKPYSNEVWDDQIFKLVMSFSPLNPYSQALDQGILERVRTLEALIKLWGKPQIATATLDELQQYPSSFGEFFARFETPKGAVSVYLYLLPNLADRGVLHEKFLQHSRSADFISYNGHAGLGDDVHQFFKMIEMTPHQTILINGCNTFSYLSLDYLQQIKANNTHMITNVLPSYVDQNSFTNAVLIKGIYDGHKDYLQLFRTLDARQRILLLTAN